MTVWVNVLKVDESLPTPQYQTKGAAGFDLYAAEDLMLRPHQTYAMPLGVKVEIQPGYEMQLRPRSGLAMKQGITLLNSPGTIDSDFRGEVKALLINHSYREYFITKGDKICQAVIAPVAQAILREVRGLNETDRGEGGFGSTGK